VDRTIPTIIVIVVVLGVLALMTRSWLRRRTRDAGLTAGYPLPPETAVSAGDAVRSLATVPALYVATTPRDQPLERLAIRGLGFRARAELRVRPDGVILTLAGENAVFIPVGAIHRLTTATWAIDRAVETDGLLLLGWRLSGRQGTAHGTAPDDQAADVDSYFRVTDPADRARVIDAIHSIAPAANFPSGTTESEA
jgi:hypothetical protein